MKLLLTALPAALLLVSCQTPIPTSPEDAAITKAQTLAEARRNDYRASVDEYNMREIAKNPSRWAGQPMSFDGKVLWIRESSEGTTLQVLDGTVSVVVAWPKPDMPGVVEGSYVGFLGAVTGSATGRNALGGEVESIKFLAQAWVSKTQYGEYYHFQGPLDPIQPDGYYMEGQEYAFGQWRKAPPPLPH